MLMPVSGIYLLLLTDLNIIPGSTVFNTYFKNYVYNKLFKIKMYCTKIQYIGWINFGQKNCFENCIIYEQHNNKL